MPKQQETLAGLEPEEHMSTYLIKDSSQENPITGQNDQTTESPPLQTYRRKKQTVENVGSSQGQTVSNEMIMEVLKSIKDMAKQQEATLKAFENSVSNGSKGKGLLISEQKDEGLEVSSSRRKAENAPIENGVPKSWYIPAPGHDAHDLYSVEPGYQEKAFGKGPRTHVKEAFQHTVVPEMNRPYSNALFEPFSMRREDHYQHKPVDGQAFYHDKLEGSYLHPVRANMRFGENEGYHYQPPQDNLQEPLAAQRVPQNINPNLRNEVLEVLQEHYGPIARGVQIPTYRMPYPEWIDRQFEVPRGYKMPNFALFHGDGKQSTLEHVARFTAQLKELGNNPFMKLKLFPNSLTGTAFEWFSNLPPNSVQNWNQMEEMFHAQYYQTIPEVTLADLARIKQKPDEKVDSFIDRFKRAKNKCKLQLPEVEFVRIAQDGLNSELRKRFGTDDFKSLIDMTYKVSRYESILEEDFNKANSSFHTYYRDPNYDIDAAEIVEHEPVFCDNLVRKESTISQKFNNREINKVYSFDISKADDIFDYLLRKKYIKLPDNVKLPSNEERKGKTYCKWHDVWTHSTKNCKVFRDRIQEQIKKGKIKFPEKSMGIDADPFPKIQEVAVNMVIPSAFEDTVKKVWQDQKVQVNMNTIQVNRPNAGHSKDIAKKETADHYVPRKPRSQTSPEKGSHFPTLEASFLEVLCLNCRVDYMKFKDLDSRKVSFFPKSTGRNNFHAEEELISVIPVHTKKQSPWVSSKRNASGGSPSFSYRKNFPPLKRAHYNEFNDAQGKLPDHPEPYHMVKGVPDWFVKKTKPELFHSYGRNPKDSLSNYSGKTFKPQNAPIGQWTLVRDPKTRIPRMQPVLSNTQVRKIQRKYTLYKAGALPYIDRPNPRFNRKKMLEHETSHWRQDAQDTKEVLSRVSKAMEEDEGEEGQVSPRSLASYQNDLLDVMMIEQEKEESISPMEISALEISQKKRIQ